MKKMILFVFVMALFLVGCTSSDGTGNFKLYLTDKPIDNAEEIWVTISEINVHKEDEGFIPLWSGESGEKTYNLLELRFIEEKIVDSTLPEGTYTQIRLVVTAGEIVIAGEPEPYIMTVPSSEVKIPLVFYITEGGATEVLLDFEADHSIHVVGAGQSEQYILRPVIKVKSVSH